MIVIADCGLGNVGALENMLRKAGGAAQAVRDPTALAGAAKLVLPGVGAFDQGVERLQAGGWWEPILAFARANKPVLGVCLGSQLLGQASEEGQRAGLGLIPMRSVRIAAEAGGRRLLVPHMGWNEVRALRDAPLLAGLETEARFYFAHSYRFVCDDPADVAAVCEYGGELPVYVRRGAVQGVQFHPEKSHRFGLTLFRNFVAGGGG